MDLEPNLMAVEGSESTALVCVDHEQYQKLITPQLVDLKYKVNLGL